MKLSLPSFERVRFFRGLRFRLAASYVLFFAVLLSFLGIFFRQTLKAIYDDQAQRLLTEEWGAVKGYLRIDKGKIDWYYDTQDPDEAYIVDRLKQIYLLTDANGKPMEWSEKYKDELGFDSPADIRAALKTQKPIWTARRNKQGVEYMIRSGPFIDDNHKTFWLALGRSLGESDRIVDEFTWKYFLILPLMIVTSSFLGWYVARRALIPVDDVARTAERITGSNLTAQIPSRGANDELDRLIGAFNSMIERLNSSFTQTRQFSTDVSHELRTPLTAIRGQLEVALLTAKTKEQYRDAIVDSLQDVERLSHTIRALLLLSQAESGQLAIQWNVLDLVPLAADIVDQFQIPFEGGHVALTASFPAECRIEGDRIQIERLLSNLLSNALKYTPEGGSAHVSMTCDAAQVRIVVEDTGVGIADDHLPHIFDRFYRVPTMDRSPEKGLGLGLSFVAWIVKAHRGTIEVESRLGTGTKFTITLPVAPPVPEPEFQMAHSDQKEMAS
jgi:heavy metal sensor kinase